MMETYQLLMIIGMFGGAAVLGVIALILYFYVKEESEEHNFCFNLMSHKYSNRAYGDILEMKSGPYGRKMILMRPKDLSLKEVLKGDKNIPIKIFYNKNHEVVLAKWDISAGKNINIICPNKASELNEKLAATPLGKCISLWIELQNADKTAIMSLQKGMEAQAEHIKQMPGGEATISLMNYFKEYMNDALEASLKQDKNKNPLSSFTSPQSSGI